MCLPVDKGGLDLRSLEDFNIVLILKWRWRIFEASNSLWYRILKARYGDVRLKALIGDKKTGNRSKRSIWWSNISSLEKSFPEDFLVKNLKFRVGLGHSISFWHASRSDAGIIKDIFLNLFDLSLLQDVSISNMGGWIDEE
ncbi:uncharacterized protein LOC131596924 [Vicia villosa]|uniref:uncharacterized protein LOC131596922 n=1 Tax=Vicia villosa TaxID=3911 RepID=UPI00273A880F|nr:uncharacterized protein LOC131596922 [Vicia villosa]XP_058725640.1 uncharacterized protein LOC131596924 [Vicia villosa]